MGSERVKEQLGGHLAASQGKPITPQQKELI